MYFGKVVYNVPGYVVDASGIWHVSPYILLKEMTYIYLAQHSEMFYKGL